MAVRALGAALVGVDAVPVEVEVDLLRRLPAVTLVGLAASAVKESAERVRSAIEAAGEEFPRKRVVVNLAPADLRKEGTALDLPIALGILAADGIFDAARLEGVLTAGELALSGDLRSVRGALSLALLARRMGRTLILPACVAPQAALVPGVEVRAAETLGELLAWLKDEGELPFARPVEEIAVESGPDLSEVSGQGQARRALELAAAGAHHLLLTGPPGCGKSMLAQRLPSILPPMSHQERLESTRVHGVAGLLREARPMVLRRPFRAPHHSLTVPGLIGDRFLRPGEVSLAHHGVLFLDEAPEFQRAVLEVLRAPLEDGVVRVSRASGSVTFPASVTLVLAANPCPCGHRGTDRGCICPPSDVTKYQRRLSGPILDRVDLQVALRPVAAEELLGARRSESSAVVRARVVAARERQLARGQTVPNGRLPAEALDGAIGPSGEARRTLIGAAKALGLSARAVTRVMRVARTAADLTGRSRVGVEEIEEALRFRTEEAGL